MEYKKAALGFCLVAFFHFHDLFSMDNDVLKDIAIGSAAGIGEVVADQPWDYFKAMRQQGQKISINPRLWWRGTVVNAATMAPITAIQVAGYNQILKKMTKEGDEPGAIKRVLAAGAAGIASAVFSAPAGLITIHQQNSDTTLHQTVNQIVWRYGLKGLYRGFVPVASRDGGFTVGLLEGRRVMRKKLEQYTNNSAVLDIGAGMGSGLIAGVTTHPFDTIKTHMQANVHDYHHGNMGLVLRNVCEKDGFEGLYKGVGARSARVALAITIIGKITDELNKRYKN